MIFSTGESFGQIIIIARRETFISSIAPATQAVGGELKTTYHLASLMARSISLRSVLRRFFSDIFKMWRGRLRPTPPTWNLGQSLWGVETRNIFIFRLNIFRVVNLMGVETRNISWKIFRLLSSQSGGTATETVVGCFAEFSLLDWQWYMNLLIIHRYKR